MLCGPVFPPQDRLVVAPLVGMTAVASYFQDLLVEFCCTFLGYG